MIDILFPWRNAYSTKVLPSNFYSAYGSFTCIMNINVLAFIMTDGGGIARAIVTYVVVIFRKKMLVGADGENSCVDETFPRHKIKYPLHFLNTSDAHETPDDDVRNTFLRSKSFLCLEIKPNC